MIRQRTTSLGLAAVFLTTALFVAVPTAEAGIPERCATLNSGPDQTTTCIWTTGCPVSRHHSGFSPNWDEEYCLNPAGACAVERHVTFMEASFTECVVPGPGITQAAAIDPLAVRRVTVGPCAAGYQFWPDNSGVYGYCTPVAGFFFGSTLLGPTCRAYVLDQSADPCRERIWDDLSLDVAGPCDVDYLIHSHGTDYTLACNAAGHEVVYMNSYTTITGDTYCERRALDGAYREDCSSHPDS